VHVPRTQGQLLPHGPRAGEQPEGCHKSGNRRRAQTGTGEEMANDKGHDNLCGMCDF
jgi:hypothetical protein